MKTTLTLSWILLLSLLVATMGCDKGVGDDKEDDEALSYGTFALEAEDGGFEESAPVDEFVSEEAGEFEEDDLVEDAEAVTPEVEALEAEPEADHDVYFVSFVWGQLKFDADSTDAVEWDGTLTVSDGGIRILRAIKFEKVLDQDTILPRTDPAEVAFESTTYTHHDGLLVKVIVPADAESPTITLTTAQVSTTYDLGEDLSDLVHVDDAGNKVAVAIVKRDPAACHQGFLAGYWKRIAKKGGIFGGRWVELDGTLRGKVVGLWGKKLDGTRRLVGAYFAKDGTFKGVLKGTYAPKTGDDDPDVPGAGTMSAKFHSLDGAIFGELGGLYRVHVKGKKGTFMAKWKTDCEAGEDLEDTTEGDTE